ncbi:hypothetical protein B566_EDAN014456 [Ephemera danica]|nr:hypothetical protein B566_EDAN014456 [Ephemera danica]
MDITFLYGPCGPVILITDFHQQLSYKLSINYLTMYSKLLLKISLGAVCDKNFRSTYMGHRKKLWSNASVRLQRKVRGLSVSKQPTAQKQQ